MEASDILRRALLAVLLLLIEVDPGASGGVNRTAGTDDHQGTSVIFHCCRA